MTAVDNTKKSILARGCDPLASLRASRAIPPLVGNPVYVPTTTDEEFIDELQSRRWSIVFFAPGTCRFSAANQPIPGSTPKTASWTLEQYRELIRKHQGDATEIVEAFDEREPVGLLKEALSRSRETHSPAD